MDVNYYNPETGEVHGFPPSQTPPPGWKRLKPIALHPGWNIISKGGCVLFEPGREPKLYLDPDSGETKWLRWPYIAKGNWKPFVPLFFPPAGTTYGTEYFDPQSGQSYHFQEGQTPPPGWKKLQPIPPHPSELIAGKGGCALFEPGKEPKLLVDPKTGESRWMYWPYTKPSQFSLPLSPLIAPPPLTENSRQYFNPATGETYNFKKGETPPPGWKKFAPVPPHPDWHIVGKGGDVLYEPGKEPKLFVDPETGESKWFQWPYDEIDSGWQEVKYLFTPPANTKTEDEYFDPLTGQSYHFKDGQEPPAGWKKLKPRPPIPGSNIISNGGCVLYEPGKEPRLFVDPETGESQWVQWPFRKIGADWKPLGFLSGKPPMTERTNDYFNPMTGDCYTCKPGETPADDWKKLKPVPFPPDWNTAGNCGCLLYEPGKEPRLFVDTEAGDSKWVQWPYEDLPTTWLPLNFLPGNPDKINEVLNIEGDTPEYWDEEDDDDQQIQPPLDHSINFLMSDPAKLLSALLVSADPILEWSIWNPIFNASTISKWNPAVNFSPLNFYYSEHRLADLKKILALRKSVWALRGGLIRVRGLVLEGLAGGNLRAGSYAADVIEGGDVIQIKSFYNTTLKNVASQIKRAAPKLLKLFKSNPSFYKGSIFKIQSIVPTGTTESVVDSIYDVARQELKPAMAEVGVESGASVVKGIPGAIGKGLKGLSFAGGVFSTYQLVQDIRKGDVASGIGNGAGTATFVLETGGTLIGSTAMTAGSALTASFALGYAGGTLINDHVLSDQTKSLIGETLVEFEDHGFQDIKEFYGGKAKATLRWLGKLVK